MAQGGDNRSTDPGEIDASELESVPPGASSRPPPPRTSTVPTTQRMRPVAATQASPTRTKPIAKPPVPRAPMTPGGTATHPLPREPLAGANAPPATLRTSDAPPKTPSFPPRASPWRATLDRLVREVDARQALEPQRAALLLTAYARLCVDALDDPLRATQALARADGLAPESRFVANTWRWLAEQGADPIAILQRARAELQHLGEGRERTALLWQIAAIESHVASDITAAKRTASELLALDPTEIGARDLLGSLHLRLRASDDSAWEETRSPDDVVFAGVVESLEGVARAVADPITRGALYAAAGALRDRYLADVEGAIASLHRALEADPDSAAAQATLEGILLRRRAWDGYALVITSQAERSRDPRTAAECFERAGDVYAECLSDAARAAQCFQRAAALDESDPGPLEKLVLVLEAVGRWDDAANAYERLLQRVHDPIAKAWSLVRLGGLHERRDRLDDALTAYRFAVEAAPTFAPATQALLRLARVRGLGSLAIELERREADRIVDPYARAVRYAAIAEILEVQGPKALEDATVLYDRTLALDPTNAAAFDALDRIHRAAGQWGKLLALHEAALARTTDPRRARSLRLGLAEIQHSRMQKPGAAADLLREALAGPEDRFDTLVCLSRALADAGRWTEYVEALEAQASMLDGAEEIAAVYRIAAALETRVKDTRRALETYEVVLDRAPRHEAAARAILRIHEQEGRYEQVIEAERRLLDLAPRPEDVVEGLLRIARVAEEQLGRVDEAIAAYSEALKRAPAYPPAIASLERLLRKTGDYRRLAQALRTFAEAVPDPRAKARAMVRAASILELCMDDGDSASAVYTRALAGPASGDERERHDALWGLARLQETRGEWESLDQTLGKLLETTTEPTARLRVLVRFARNAELRLADLPRALARYDEAIATGVNRAALAGDQLRVARGLGHRDTIRERLATMATCTTDERLERGLLRELALFCEHAAPAPGRGGGGASDDVEAAASLYERLVARDSEDPQALDGLIRCTSEAPRDPRLPPALMARARATSDLAVRALLALGAGALEEEAGRFTDAEEAYAFALAADAELLPAIDASRRLRVRAGDHRAVATLAERAAAVSVDRENAAQSWLDAADVYEFHLDDPALALSMLRALLGAQPEHRIALERAMKLLEAFHDWSAAAALLLAHIEASTDPMTQARCLTQRAAILAGRIGDTPAAIVDLRRAMALRSHAEGEGDVTTIEVLAVLEERTRNWQEARELHARVARTTTDLAIRRRARLAEARIVADELKDHAQAKAILEELVREVPEDREVLLRLAHASAKSADEARAHEIYSNLAQSGSPVDRARALVALSDLKRARPDMWPAQEGDAVLARAFDLALADPAVIGVLEERAARDGDFRPFAAHAEAAIGRVPPNTRGILAMRTALARALREQLGNPGAADRHLAAAIAAFPDSMPTRLALAAGLRGRNDEAALAELRRAVEADPSVPEPFEALVTLAIATGRPEVGSLLASAASLLGGTGDELEVSLADATPLRTIPDALLFDEAMSRLVGPSRAFVLRSILAIVDPFLPKIFPAPDGAYDPSSRLPDSYPIVTEARAIAATLGVPTPTIHRGGARDVALLLTEPKALVLGTDYLVDIGRPVAVFHVAYACARCAGNGSIYTVPRRQIVALLDAIAKPDADGPLVRDVRKRVASALPRKNKKDLERIVLTAPNADLHAELGQWEAEETRRALFAAVLSARDLRAAGQVLAPDVVAATNADDRRRALSGSARLRELLEFVISPACWDLFKRLYGRS